jgi:WD40 repeat protein
MDDTWDSCRQVLETHGGGATAVTYAPDGQLLASACDDGIVSLWDPDTGALLQIPEVHDDLVQAIAFAPKGQLLALGLRSGRIKLWDLNTRTLRQTLKGHGGWVWAVAFAPDSQILASTSDDKTIKLWDTGAGVLRQTLKTNASVGEGSFGGPTAGLHKIIRHLRFDDESRIWSTAPHSAPASYSNYALSDDNCWITQYGYNMLWLPPDYRGSCSAVSPLATQSATMMAFGCYSGKVMIIGLLDTMPPM